MATRPTTACQTPTMIINRAANKAVPAHHPLLSPLSRRPDGYCDTSSVICGSLHLLLGPEPSGGSDAPSGGNAFTGARSRTSSVWGEVALATGGAPGLWQATFEGGIVVPEGRRR